MNITLELEDIKYQIPSDWMEVSIGMYQEMTQIPQELTEIDKTIEIISILSSIPKESLLDLPATDYIKLVEAISFISSDIPDKLLQDWTFEDITYKFQCDLNEMTTAQYIDMDALSKTSDPINLHTLMSVVYRPENTKYNSKDTFKRREVMKHMPIGYAVAAQAFMTVLDQILSEVSVDSSIQ